MKRHVAVIDAGGANLGSVTYALERLGERPHIIRSAEGLHNATHVILPGVGTASEAMKRLLAQGLLVPLQQLQVPLLGVCLGMQLLFCFSEEGAINCLGLIPGNIRAIPATQHQRVPHMGWNRLQHTSTSSQLLEGIKNGDWAYFVHSYAAEVTDHTIAQTTHSIPFSAAVQYKHFYGVQFHPERSSNVGNRILSNFLRSTVE